MSLNRHIASLAAVLAVLLMPFWVHAQDSSKDWHHSVYIYAMGAAIDGTAQIGPVVVPVDLSVSDVFGALEFGAMPRTWPGRELSALRPDRAGSADRCEYLFLERQNHV